MCLLLAGHKPDLITVVFWQKENHAFIGKDKKIKFLRTNSSYQILERGVLVVISSILCFGFPFIYLFWREMGQKLEKYLDIEESTWPLASEWNLQLRQISLIFFTLFIQFIISLNR